MGEEEKYKKKESETNICEPKHDIDEIIITIIIILNLTFRHSFVTNKQMAHKRQQKNKTAAITKNTHANVHTQNNVEPWHLK